MKIEFLPITDINQDYKAGTLLKSKTGEVKIVGHLNEQEGYCNCCTNGDFTEYSISLVQFINEIIDKEHLKTGFIQKS